MVLAEGQLEVIIEIPVDNVVKDRGRAVSESVQVAAKRHEVPLELRGDVLPDASGADAVASAVMAVPVLVFEDVVDVVLVIRSQTESAKLPLAFVVYVLIL